MTLYLAMVILVLPISIGVKYSIHADSTAGKRFINLEISIPL